MKFRVLEVNGCKTTKKVCLMIYRTDEGEDVVKIFAWHNKEGEDFFQIEILTDFPTINMMENFIMDFSTRSAEDFAKSFQF